MNGVLNLRGNTGKHTTYGRMSEHQIKKVLLERVLILECYNNINSNNNSKYLKVLFFCLNLKVHIY